MSKPSIAFCMISGRYVHSTTAHDYAGCLVYTALKGHPIALAYTESAILAEARTKGIKAAIENGADYVFLFDSDMRFPKYTVDRLLEWDQPVVAANCSKRKRPVGPTARRKAHWVGDSTESESVWPDPEILGLEQVELVGFGIMLIKADVFMKIEYPWFDMPFVEEADKWVGEDTFFCKRLKDADIPLFIDHGLSWQVRHIGDYEFGMRDVLDERAAVEAGLWELSDG